MESDAWTIQLRLTDEGLPPPTAGLTSAGGLAGATLDSSTCVGALAPVSNIPPLLRRRYRRKDEAVGELPGCAAPALACGSRDKVSRDNGACSVASATL